MEGVFSLLSSLLSVTGYTVSLFATRFSYTDFLMVMIGSERERGRGLNILLSIFDEDLKEVSRVYSSFQRMLLTGKPKPNSPEEPVLSIDVSVSLIAAKN